MAAPAFMPGAEVYLEDGAVARVVAADGGEYIVRPILEVGGEEAWEGKPFTVAKVWAAPPREKYDADIQARREQLDGLTDACRAMLQAKAEFEREERERRERLQLHNLLQPLDDLLADRITHILRVTRFGLQLSPLVEALREHRDRYCVIPIQLTGDSDFYSGGRVRWEVKGTDTGFYRSFEDAQAAAAVIMDARYATYRAGKPRGYGIAVLLERDARQCQLEVPKDIAEEVRTQALASAQAALESAGAAYRKAKAAVDALVEPPPSEPEPADPPTGESA